MILTSLVSFSLFVVAQAPAQFAAGIETVYVDVSVTDGDDSVTGLAAPNFEVQDNGVRQVARLVASIEATVTTILVFDASQSVSGPKLENLKLAGRAVVSSLSSVAEAALVTFNSSVRLAVGPTLDHAALSDTISSLQSEGSTALLDAVYGALTMPVSERRRVVIVFTDGDDTVSWLNVDQVRQAAARSDALLHIVGLRRRVRDVATFSGFALRGVPTVTESSTPLTERLRDLAEVTGGAFWEAEDADALRETFLRVFRQTQQRYVLAYEPRDGTVPGEHEIRVRLKGAKGKVRHRRRYYASPREIGAER